MTLATTSNTTVAQGNGLTSSFTFTFPVPAASELFVYFTGTTGAVTLLSNSQYSVTGIGNANGGSVTYPLVGSPIATGTSLTIQREVPYQQLTSLVDQSGYYPNVVEAALDYLTMQTQQLAEQETLSLKVPLASTSPNLTYPSAAGRANTLAGFDSLGNAVTYPVTASVGAGNLTSEGPFVANVNFTPNVTTTLVLSKAYGTSANVSVHFDGTYQGTDQYSLVGTSIIFTSPIPLGVNKVYVVGGTTLSASTPANGSVTDASLSPSSAVAIITSNIWTLKRFGAKGDGVTDDTIAIQAAFNSGQQEIFIDPGQYLSGPLTIPAKIVLRGAGSSVSTFVCNSANSPAISILTAGLIGIELRDFGITSASGITPVSGGNGLYWPVVTDYSTISNILVSNRWNGMLLGPAAYGVIENCRAEQNLNDGFRFESSANIAGVAIQWVLNTLLSQKNGANGYIYQSNGGTGNISVGTCTNLSSFANNNFGFAVQGTSTCPIQGVRLVGGFFGQDGNHEVYLDTYGTEHKIDGTFAELAGTASTGPSVAIPPSGQGSGFFITTNNVDVHLNNVLSSSHSKNGLISQATLTTINGGNFFNNGVAGDASNAFGVYKLGGVLCMSGGASGNINGSTYQQYGVAASNGSGLLVTGVNLLNNTVNTAILSTNATSASFVGNLGGNTAIPAGGVTVGIPSAGAPGNGQINVATGVELNGVAYTNP